MSKKVRLKIKYIDTGSIDIKKAMIDIYAYVGQKLLTENNIKGYTIIKPSK